MAILPKLMSRCNEIPIRSPVDFFVIIDKLVIKFIWNSNEPKPVKIIVKKRNKAVRLTRLDFRT